MLPSEALESLWRVNVSKGLCTAKSLQHCGSSVARRQRAHAGCSIVGHVTRAKYSTLSDNQMHTQCTNDDVV